MIRPGGDAQPPKILYKKVFFSQSQTCFHVFHKISKTTPSYIHVQTQLRLQIQIQKHMGKWLLSGRLEMRQEVMI